MEVLTIIQTGALHNDMELLTKDMELLTKEFGMPNVFFSKTSIVRKVKPLVTIKAKMASNTKAIKTGKTTNAKPKSKKKIVKKKSERSLKKKKLLR